MPPRGRHRRPAPVPSGALLAALALGILTSGTSTAGLAVFRATPAGVLHGPAGATSGSTTQAPGVTGVASTGGHTSGGSGSNGGSNGSSGSSKGGGISFDSYDPSIGHGWKLSIPAIDVVASVVDLGLNADGTLEVPTDFDLTGWYSLGPKPGEVGPAVIVGHVDSTDGAAVFYRLREMKPGEKVKVVRGKVTYTFVVTSVGQYPKAAFPTAKVYGLVKVPALRLITCGGAFNSLVGHYTDNFIVFAKLSS